MTSSGSYISVTNNSAAIKETFHRIKMIRNYFKDKKALFERIWTSLFISLYREKTPLSYSAVFEGQSYPENENRRV